MAEAERSIRRRMPGSALRLTAAKLISAGSILLVGGSIKRRWRVPSSWWSSSRPLRMRGGELAGSVAGAAERHGEWAAAEQRHRLTAAASGRGAVRPETVAPPAPPPDQAATTRKAAAQLDQVQARETPRRCGGVARGQ